jgi:hypothetical protein
MGDSRFVRPQTAVLKISGGDTLTVKRRLTSGELRDQLDHAYAWRDGQHVFDPIRSGLALCVAYLVDWSLTDAEGVVVEIRGQGRDVVEAALNGLDTDDFKEIKQAIELHEKTMDAERAAAKNGRGGVSNSPAITPSLDEAAGPLTSSAH